MGHGGSEALDDLPAGTHAATITAGLARLANVVRGSSQAPDALIARSLQVIAESLGVQVAILSRVEGDTRYHIEHIHDSIDTGIPPGASFDLYDTYCATLLAGAMRSLSIADGRADARFAARLPVRVFGLRAYSGIPLYRSSGELYGTLCVLHRHPRTVRTGEVTLLELAGRIMMDALEVQELRAREQSLRRQALHDVLTGLPNRLLLSDRLERALQAARREQTRVAVLMIDVNGFKEINDTRGHAVGDAVLQHVGARMQGALRVSDTVARLGGDEFVAVLPSTGEDGAIAAARVLAQALRPATPADAGSIAVTVSIGITLYPDHGSDQTTLLRHADQAMYAAKRDGGGYRVHTSIV